LAMAVFLLVKPYFRIASTSDLSLVFVCSAFIAFCFQLLTIEALSRSTIFIIFPFAIHILVCVSQDRRAYVSGHEAVSR
jgi:predicted membrane protein